jgi:hypothetical protein
MFESFRRKETKEESFARNKKEVIDFIKNDELSGSEISIDSNIKTLVEKLNKLPFLYTTGSCEGHVCTSDSEIADHPNSNLKDLRLPPTGFARYFSGFIHFKIDGSDSSLRFLEELKLIVDKFSNAEYFFSDNNVMIEFDPRRKSISASLKVDVAKQYQEESVKLIKEIENITDNFITEANLDKVAGLYS